MAKGLSERISERMKSKKPSISGTNRAAFLAVKEDVIQALDDGWPVKTIWETLAEEGKIPFGYDAFINYVNRLIKETSANLPLPKPVSEVLPQRVAPQAQLPQKEDTSEPKMIVVDTIKKFVHNPK